MKRAAIIVSAIVALIALAALALVLRPPTGMIGQRLAAQVRDATGRDVTVKGGTTVSLGWRMKVRMDGVTLANPAGMTGDPLLVADAVEVETPTIAALTGSASIDTLRLVAPRLALARDAAGRDNWTFATTGASTVSVRDLQVTGGRIAFTDATAKTSATLEGLEGSASGVTSQKIGATSFKGTKASLDLDGATAVLEQPVVAAKDATTAAIGTIDVSGTKLTLAGLGDGLEVNLDAPAAHGSGLSTAKLDALDLKAAALSSKLPGGATATLDVVDAHATGVKPDAVATLTLKANGARYADTGGIDVALDGLAADAKALAAEEIGSLALDAKAARYRLADGSTGSLDGVHAEQKAITPDSIAELALKGASLKHTSAGGLAVDATDFAAASRELSPAGIGVLRLDSRTLGYRLADGSSGSFDTLHGDATGIKTEGVGVLALKAAGLKHALAGGIRLELGDLTAVGKAVSTTAIGEASLQAATLATVDGDVRIELSKVDAATKDGKLPGPLDITLGFDWKGERVAGNVKLDELGLPTEAKALPLAVNLKARGGTLALDGTLSAAREFEGKGSAAVKSVRDVAKWLGFELPKDGPLAAASANGRVKATTKRLELADATLALDATKAKGSLTIDISGERPSLKGKLAADTFDADAYGLTTAPRRDGAPTALALDAADAAPPAAPLTLKDALKGFARAELARIEQPAANAEAAGAATATRKPAPAWSDAPIDFGFLKKSDLDLALSCDKLRLAGLDVGVPSLTTKLDNGILSLDGRDLALKGGKVSGRAAIEARSGSPRAAASFKADNVEALDLFDALGLTRTVVGKSSIDADLGGTVGSQKQLVESVTGSVKVKMGKGSVIGYDPGQILSYVMGNGGYDAKARWPFSRLDADMSLDKGLSKNTKVSVDTAVAGANSDGTTDLPKREIDYQAKLNTSFWFQPILVRIFGAWNSPKWAADVFDTSRGATLASAEGLAKLDIKDAELARLLGELIDKSPGSAQPLDPAVLDTLRVLKARAGG